MKVGDKVQIKRFDWYQNNKTNGVVELIDNDDRGYNFVETICSSYEMVEDNKDR